VVVPAPRVRADHSSADAARGLLAGGGDLLHNRDGALADERDRHWVGADALARDAAGGVGCAQPHERADPGSSGSFRRSVSQIWKQEA